LKNRPEDFKGTTNRKEAILVYIEVQIAAMVMTCARR
jgi:hypothetical protein